jgi:hypothetical protein
MMRDILNLESGASTVKHLTLPREVQRVANVVAWSPAPRLPRGTGDNRRWLRQVSIPGGFGAPYTAVLTDTGFGPMIVLLGSERPPMGWWRRVVRVEP